MITPATADERKLRIRNGERNTNRTRREDKGTEQREGGEERGRDLGQRSREQERERRAGKDGWEKGRLSREEWRKGGKK